MMIDYNVRKDWPQDTPDWLKSLVSSLSRKDHSSSVLPLTVTTQEILDWVELASGEDAWARPRNRQSLREDLDQSISSLGPSLRGAIAPQLSAFVSGFEALTNSDKAILAQSPNPRTERRWENVRVASRALLASLQLDTAVGSCWDDVVAIARDRTLETRDYQPVVDLLFDMVERRGLSAKEVFRHAVDMLAYAREPGDPPFQEREMPVEERIAKARDSVMVSATIEPIAVWLGFKGVGHVPQIEAGNVHFFQANWHIPNSLPGRPDFAHKTELAEITRNGHTFKWEERIGDDYDVDFLVRVDLGDTTAARAFERAIEVVDTIFAVAIHATDGTRPNLAQYVVIQSGQPITVCYGVSQPKFEIPDDYHGAHLAQQGLERHAAKIADGLARADLPRFLAAALEARTAADLPFSRAFILRPPSIADRRAVIPLADRVVQHCAAYAAMKSEDLYAQLVPSWAHVRWLSDLQNAVLRCLLGAGPSSKRTSELLAQFYAASPNNPWMLFVTEHENELLDLCQLEHERGWITKLLRSLRDRPTYERVIEEYQAESDILCRRRDRVRNALVHGNPAQFAVVESVQGFAEFLSNTALAVALEAFTSQADFQTVFAQSDDFWHALQDGQTAADYWRS